MSLGLSTSMFNGQNRFSIVYIVIMLLIPVLFLFSGCDNSSVNNENSGSIIFSLGLETSAEEHKSGNNSESGTGAASSLISASVNGIDCSKHDIGTINCKVYDNDEHLMTESSFACSLGAAKIESIPAGEDRIFIIEAISGEQTGSTLMYQATVTGITITAWETTNLGKIILECVDQDSDGYYAAIECGTLQDCNDEDEEIHPGETEICNDGIDNDCDSLVDCEDEDECFQHPDCIICTDADGDGYYEESYCDPPVDCNDNDRDVHPGPEELLCDDGKDNDCDGLIDTDDPDCEVCTDADGDGYYAEEGCGTAVDCDDSDSAINPWQTEICRDGKDNDCDGEIDEGCLKQAWITLYPKPCGSTYRIGEYLRLYIHVEEEGTYTLSKVEVGGQESVMQDNETLKPGDYPLEDIVGEPTGRHTFKLYDETNGELLHECYIDVRESVIVCTDSDNDGYYAQSGCGTSVDCDDNDQEVYPGNEESSEGSCYDGKDNDCDGDTDGADPGCYNYY